MINQSVTDLTAILDDINSHLGDIASAIEVLSYDPWVMYGVLSSILVAAVAVYASNKDYFHGFFCKPKIQIDEHAFTLQQNTALVSRLTVTNLNKTIAKNVTFINDELWYFENNNWVKTSNFLPFPLRWTHDKANEHKNLYYLQGWPGLIGQLKAVFK
jgi:hypothetical protein